jgi:hypothetical protein
MMGALRKDGFALRTSRRFQWMGKATTTSQLYPASRSH